MKSAGGLGPFLLAWLKEAREQYPGDLERQALYVRRKVAETQQAQDKTIYPSENAHKGD